MLLVVSEYLTGHTASCRSRLVCYLSCTFSAMMLAAVNDFRVGVYVVPILRLPFLNDLLLKPEENESGSTKSVVILLIL